MKDLVGCDTNKSNKSYESIELWINDDVRSDERFQTLRGFAKDFREAAEKLITSGNELVAFLDGVDGAADCQRDIATIVIDAKEMLQSSELIMETADPKFVYSAKLSKKPERVSEALQAQIIDVGQMLRETLYEKTESIAYASATITIGGSEELHRLHGSQLERIIPDRHLSFRVELRLRCQYAGSRDKRHTRAKPAGVSRIPPEASRSGPCGAARKHAHFVYQPQGDGSLLRRGGPRHERERAEVGVPEMRHFDQGSSRRLPEKQHLSLFALKSFWEGFDAPGATLKSVVIPKLPFAKPTDPLSCERALRDQSAWSHYTLPQAVIEIKQAAGRLIRSSTDKGVLVLADRRLLTKGYGKVFLNSLPSRTIRFCGIERSSGGYAREQGVGKAPRP